MAARLAGKAEALLAELPSGQAAERAGCMACDESGPAAAMGRGYRAGAVQSAVSKSPADPVVRVGACAGSILLMSWSGQQGGEDGGRVGEVSQDRVRARLPQGLR